MKIKILFIITLIVFLTSSVRTISQGRYWSKIATPCYKSSGGIFAVLGTLSLCNNGISYQTLDKGNSWTQTNSINYYFNDPIVKRFLIRSIVGGGFYASFNNGATWGYLHSFDYWSTINSACYMTDSTAYLATKNGVFQIVGPIKNIEQVGLNNVSINWIFYNGKDELAAFSDNKIYYSRFPFKVWIEFAKTLKFYYVTQNYNHVLFASSDEGIHKSDDFGRTWVLISNSIKGNYKILIDNNNYLLYPAELVIPNHEIFFSTDSMKTLSQLSLPQQLIYSFALDSNNLFMETDGGIFHSSDFGNFWEQKISPVPFNCNSCLMTSSGDIHYFSADGSFSKHESNEWIFSKFIHKRFNGLIRSGDISDNGKLLLFYNDTLYLSDIIGSSWKNIFKNGYWGSGRMDLDNYKITNNEILYSTRSFIEITIDPRIYYSIIIRNRYINIIEGETLKQSWERDYTDSDAPRKFYVLPNGNRYLLNSNSLYECNNNENIWNIVERLPIKDDNISGFDNDDLNNLYLLDKTGYLFKSSDNGISWRKSNVRNPYLGGSVELKSFSTNELVAYSATAINYSSDCGDSWVDISSGLSGSITKLFKNNINGYYVISSEGIFKSNNLPLYTIYSKPTLVKPKNNELINAAIESVRLIWNKTDNGDSYEIMTGNKNFDNVYHFYKGITDTTKTIPASGDTVYWKVRAVSNNISGEWSDTWRYIFNGTVGVIDKSNLPQEFRLFQNYPNPFNPETKIHYYLPEPLFVNLTIYDFLGRTAAVLVNGLQKEGAYTAVWAPKNAASGIYYYRLKAGKFEAVRKLTFIK